MTKNQTLKEIKNRVLKSKPEYTCLFDSYKYGKKLKLLCDKKHICYIRLDHLENGTSCTKCSGRSNRKITLEEIKSFLKEKRPNGKLLSIEYTNKDEKLLWECEKGHKWKATLRNVKGNKTWCPICNGNNKNNLINIINFLKEKRPNGKLLSNVYKDNKSKLLWKCEKGHTWEASYNSVNKGSWCKKCYHENKETFYDISKIKDFLEIFRPGGKILSKTYNRSKLLWECEKGHIWKSTFQNIKNDKTWCPHCLYKNENICKTIMEEMTHYKFLKSRPIFLNGLELDGFNEDLNLGFEYQGRQHYEYCPDYFHKKRGIKDFLEQICRDKIKKYLCEKNKVTLIVIPYYEKNKEQFIKKQLEKIGFIY